MLLTNVFLASAELASVAAIEGKLPTPEEYQKYATNINATASDTYRYLNFDKMDSYVSKSGEADMGPDYATALEKETARIKAQ